MVEQTRESLDRLAVSCGGRFKLGCSEHDKVGVEAIYQDGVLRVLCRACGFEAARVKVATRRLERRGRML